MFLVEFRVFMDAEKVWEKVKTGLIVEQSNRKAWVGNALEAYPVPALCCGQGCPHQIRLPRAPSTWPQAPQGMGRPMRVLRMKYRFADR